LRLSSFGGYGLALAALALVVFGAYVSYPMESSRRDFFIDVVVERFIKKTKNNTLIRYFTFVLKTGLELPKTGLSV